MPVCRSSDDTQLIESSMHNPIKNTVEAKYSKQSCCSTVAVAAAAAVYSRHVCSGAFIQHAVTYLIGLAKGFPLHIL